MDKIYEFYKKYYSYILFGLLLVIVAISEVMLFVYFNNLVTSLKNESNNREEVKEKVQDEVTFIVDIKGEVKKPGVYVLEKGKRVIDVVKKAGGLTKNASTKVNNLSMKIFDEMVIVIYSKSELDDYLNVKKEEELFNEKCTNDLIKNDSCISDSFNSDTNSDSGSSSDSSSDLSSDKKDQKVSINTATKEELMTVSGIGESKANAIIEYRKEKKFEKIEDIKNVSGIGDALFEKIKDYITT